MKGAYVLVMESRGTFLRVGKLGRIRIPRGLIAYVGSAKGPGGLEARLRRHFRRGKAKKWHVDYLTESEEIVVLGALALPGGDEGQLAQLLHEICRPLTAGFGCSDKREDGTHLFQVDDLELLRRKVREIGKVIELHSDSF